MRFANITGYIGMLILSVLPASCSKTQPELALGDEISFNMSAEVKANEITTANIYDMGVYATLDKEGTSFTSSQRLQNFMNNILVSKETNGWSASPKHYWPIDQNMKLSFFAYAPYSGNSSEIQPPANKDWSADKTLRIVYSPNENAYYQSDFCIATAALDRTSTPDDHGNIPPVQLNFKHALSWITFAANYIGDLPEGCYMIVDEIILKNVVGTNSLVYSPQQSSNFFYWEEIPAGTKRSGSYTVSISKATLSNTPIPQKGNGTPVYQDISTTEGYLFLIPQVINPSLQTRAAGEEETIESYAMIDVVFSYIKEDINNTVIAQFNTSMVLPYTSWGIGQKIKYVFTLDVNTASLITLSPSIELWEESGNTHTNTEIK